MPGAFLNSRRPLLVILAVVLGTAVMGDGLAGCNRHSAPPTPPAPPPLRERLVYDQQGIRIGIQDDPSFRSAPQTAPNSHPARFTADDIRVLLGSLQVTEFWTQTVGNKKPLPVFTADQLRLISAPISESLAQAGPSERVSFSIPDLATAPYPLRTVGALFVRGPYLHVGLTGHMEFAKAELPLAKPVQTAALTLEESPKWEVDEKLRFSINVRETLAGRAASPSSAATGQQALPPPAAVSAGAGRPGLTGGSDGQPPPGGSTEDLRLQLRELANANGDLRVRLRAQAQTIESLQHEVDRLRRQLTESSAKPGARRKSAPPAAR